MRVQLLSSEEARRVLDLIRGQEKAHASMPSPSLVGHITAVCREVGSGEIAWEVDQHNLITDISRFAWIDSVFNYGQIQISACTEQPDPRRNTLLGPGGAAYQAAGNWAPGSMNTTEVSKTWTYVFAAPAANRLVGTIGLAFDNYWMSSDWGAVFGAYSLLTPPKTQTTTQTLEVSYKIFFNPIS